MKFCPTCNTTKDDSAFGKQSSSDDGLFYQCKECKRKYDQERYQRKREDILKDKKQQYHANIEHFREYQRDYDKKRKERVYSVKQPCVKCGDDRLYLIDWHHIDPSTKEHNINRIQHCTVFRDEVKKCVCLCRNCHTEYHYLYGNRPKHPVETLTEYIGNDPYSLVPQV